LHKAVVNNINLSSSSAEEGGSLVNVLTSFVFGLSLRMFSLVSGENVVFVVDVSAEPIVVDFLSVSEIAISSCNKSEFFRFRRH